MCSRQLLACRSEMSGHIVKRSRNLPQFIELIERDPVSQLPRADRRGPGLQCGQPPRDIARDQPGGNQRHNCGNDKDRKRDLIADARRGPEVFAGRFRAQILLGLHPRHQFLYYAAAERIAADGKLRNRLRLVHTEVVVKHAP